MLFEMMERDFSPCLSFPSLKYEVDWYSFAAVGGPKQAKIKVRGNDLDLWRLIERLRSPVKIRSKKGDATWWGYIAEVQATVRDLNAKGPQGRWVRVGVALDSMRNRVAVAYSYVEPGENTVGKRATTAWVDNTESQSEYGIRELMWSGSGSTPTHAEAARDMKLAQCKLPVPIIDVIGSGQKTSGAELYCSGWWDTLGWRYYQNTNDSSVDTATQVQTIATAKGQFIAAVDMDVSAGISISEYKDGDGTALFEVEELLAMGTSNSRRMLATIDENRRMRVYEEPPDTDRPYLMQTDGTLCDPNGTPIRRELCTCGVWARLADVVPPSVNSSLLARPELQFIEEMEYDVKKNQLTPTARGAMNPWDVGTVIDG